MGLTDCAYFVVIDDTEESRLSLRYAARRAARVGGRLVVLRVVPPPEPVEWGAVQTAIAAEAREKAQALLDRVAEDARAAAGAEPETRIIEGQPGPAVLEARRGEARLAALILAAAPKGAPGPLVAWFNGERAGGLPCPVVIVPGGLAESDIDRLA